MNPFNIIKICNGNCTVIPNQYVENCLRSLVNVKRNIYLLNLLTAAK